MIKVRQLSKLREDAKKIFDAGLRAVDAKEAVRRHLVCRGDKLSLGERYYDLKEFENIYVVGGGKAGASMAAAVEDVLQDRITKGWVNVKYGHLDTVRKIHVHEAGHPVPDGAGVRGTTAIVDLLTVAGKSDLVICLLSGGGSALMPFPAEGISLAEKRQVTELLLQCGADISEINAVRKHISKIKGGQLARMAFPATLITLILSDVIGDHLDAIASGPTVPDPTTFQDVLEIVTRYGIRESLPDNVNETIENGITGNIQETPKSGDIIFSNVITKIIANNSLAVSSAKEKAERLGYHTLVLSSFVEGEAREVAKMFAAIGKEILKTGQPVQTPACVISGGETTVTIRGSGKGGRNQEFVLAAAREINQLEHIVIFSAGTDGTDGPTDAAGAFCDTKTIERATLLGMNADSYLAENNSYPFFKKLDDLLITGPTNTNVMDLQILMVDRER